MYTIIGIDLTAAMLHRAQKRIQQHPIGLHQGDVMQLPYRATSYEKRLICLFLSPRASYANST